MARILEYQQDKLVSSVVGTPGVSKAGQIIGSGIAEAAGQVQQQAFLAAKQRKDIIDTSKAAELLSQYETAQYDTMVAGQDRADFQQDPTKFEKFFTDSAKTTLENLKLGQYSPEVQRIVNAKRLDLDVSYHKKVKEWSRNQENFNAAKALTGNITRVSNSVLDAARRGSLGDAVQLMRSLDTTAASSTSVLGAAEAFKLNLQAARDPRDALLAGLMESNPVLAKKVLDDPQMDFKAHFTAAEMENKRDVVTKAIVQFEEKQQVNTLVSQIESRQNLTKAISQGTASWKDLVTLPDDDFKKYAVDKMVAVENANLTEAQKAFQVIGLAGKYKAIVGKNKKGRHSIEVLKDINDLMVDVQRADALQMIPAKTALTWMTNIIGAIKNDTVERNPWNKITSMGLPGMSGLSETNAIGKSWEVIDAWGDTAGAHLKDREVAKFSIFTRVADVLTPGKKYTDQELQNIVADQTTEYMKEARPGLKMSTNANGALMKDGGYVPFRTGSSQSPVPNAPVDNSARKAFILNLSDGTTRRGYLDAKTGKYYDRPVGGVEIK